jgi:Protein of unknown function (DUF3455)
MKRRIFTGLAAAAAVTASVLISTGAAAAAPDPTPALSATNSSAQSAGVTPNEKLPEAIQIKPSENLKIVATLRGAGKQVYDCVSGSYPAASREPEAGLFTSRGIPAGIHGKQTGPFWANFDGSHVDGSAPVAPPTQPAYTDLTKNVPWLRLTGTPLPNTTGVFSNVVAIQRIDTRGGVAPTGKCTVPSSVAVDYTANYVFWAHN